MTELRVRGEREGEGGEALFNNSYRPIEKRTATPMPFTLMPTPWYTYTRTKNKTEEAGRISVHAKVDLLCKAAGKVFEIFQNSPALVNFT